MQNGRVGRLEPRSRLALARRVWPAVLAAVVPALAAAAGAETQPAAPDPLRPIRSMGQPSQIKPFGGAFRLSDRGGGESAGAGAGGLLGFYKDLLHSAVGIGVAAEGYAAGREAWRGAQAGVRVYADLRTFYVKAGVDRPFGDGRADVFFSFAAAMARARYAVRDIVLLATRAPGSQGRRAPRRGAGAAAVVLGHSLDLEFLHPKRVVSPSPDAGRVEGSPDCRGALDSPRSQREPRG
jgi:hypothetical protein